MWPGMMRLMIAAIARPWPYEGDRRAHKCDSKFKRWNLLRLWGAAAVAVGVAVQLVATEVVGGDSGLWRREKRNSDFFITVLQQKKKLFLTML